jgi:hypothetical protein
MYWMRVNDDAMRGHGGDHYDRGNFHGNYRTLTDSAMVDDSMQRIPALMRHRAIVPGPPSTWYNHEALNQPAGATALAYVATADNVESSQFGWEQQGHSDFVDTTGPGGSHDRGLSDVYYWYEKVFIDRQAIAIG